MNSEKMRLPNEVFIEQRIKFQKDALTQFVWLSCVNCSHFEDNTEGCIISGGAKPPAHIIVNGCKNHDMDIPF